jgi:phage tail sheath gpL-like
MPKREQQRRILIIGGKKAEALGHLNAPDQEAAERKAAEQFGIRGERRKPLVAQPIAETR